MELNQAEVNFSVVEVTTQAPGFNAKMQVTTTERTADQAITNRQSPHKLDKDTCSSWHRRQYPSPKATRPVGILASCSLAPFPFAWSMTKKGLTCKNPA